MAIELKRAEEFAVITLNRPDALNALSFALVTALSRALDEVAASDARAVLITGAGQKAFCAGADIKELMGRTLIEQKRGGELGQSVFAKLDASHHCRPSVKSLGRHIPPVATNWEELLPHRAVSPRTVE